LFVKKPSEEMAFLILFVIVMLNFSQYLIIITIHLSVTNSHMILIGLREIALRTSNLYVIFRKNNRKF